MGCGITLQESPHGMKPSTAVVLDLDGVFAKSNLIKYEAIRSLFDRHSKHAAEIFRFILAHGGVPRKDKIAHIIERIVGVQARPALLVEGVAAFLVAATRPRVRRMRRSLHAAGRLVFTVRHAAPAPHPPANSHIQYFDLKRKTLFRQAGPPLAIQ